MRVGAGARDRGANAVAASDDVPAGDADGCRRCRRARCATVPAHALDPGKQARRRRRPRRWSWRPARPTGRRTFDGRAPTRCTPRSSGSPPSQPPSAPTPRTASGARRRPRHVAGIRVLDAPPEHPAHPEPDRNLAAGDPLPEIAGADVTPALLRAGILRDGCLLVRGLIGARGRGDLRRADRPRIRRARAPGGRRGAGGRVLRGVPAGRALRRSRGARLDQGRRRPARRRPRRGSASSCPELLRAAGVPDLVDGYLGEPGLMSMHKTTLRRPACSAPGAWHQDGTFMGDVRSLRLALSRCGSEAPGLDIVPCRLDRSSRPRRMSRAADPGLAGQGRGGSGRHADHPAGLRAGRRALLRRDVHAQDRVGPLDAASPVRGGELVLRRLGLPDYAPLVV